MMKLVNILTLIALLGLLVVGCENNPNPVRQNGSPTMGLPGTAKVAIPDGATIESVKLNIYVADMSNQIVDIHRVMSAWDENIVTWNSFGGSYNGNVEASFIADAVGWKLVDLTTLFEGWLDGTYENYGFLMTHADFGYPRTVFNSKEAEMYKPYITFCYNLGSETICEEDIPIGDTYIYENEPDVNFGWSIRLRAGWPGSIQGEPEKQTLIQFEIDQMVEPAELGDRVWIDDNMNGIQDDGEAGYAGVTVDLYDCQGEFMATTMTDENGYYLFTDLMPGDYYVEFDKPDGYVFTMQDIGDDTMDSDADANTGMTDCTTLASGESNLTLDAGLYMIPDDCGECDGKITELTFKYLGDASAEIIIYTKKDHNVLFSGVVDPDETFNFIGNDKHGTMGTEIEVYVEGKMNVKIHTSCSQPLEIGMVFGDFEVIDGYSRNGGKICVYNGPGEDPEDPDCGTCDGKITELTFKYLGDASAEIIIHTKKDHNVLFSGVVDPDETFNFIGNDKHGTMGTEIEVYVEGEMNVKIHTSCSQPLEIGMVFGDFEVIDGYSRNGGQICTYDGDDGEETRSFDNDGCDHKKKHKKNKKHHHKHKK